MAKLTFVLEDGQEEVPLADRLSLGRAEDNDVVVDDERLSDHHAEVICHADGRVEVRDLCSTTGTLVNDVRVESRILRQGDRLSFGPLTAVLDLEEQETTSEAPAEKKPSARPGPDAEEDTASLAKEKQRLQEEVDDVRQELADWRLRAEKERSAHESRIITLRAAEERMLPLQAAAKHAETTHGEWLAAIQTLAAEHEEKSAELQKLAATEAATKAKLEAHASQQEKESALLEQLRKEREREEARVDELRQQAGAAETAAKGKLDALSAQQKQDTDRLEQLRKECELETARREALRQQAADAEASKKSKLETLKAQEEQESARLGQLRLDCERETARHDELSKQAAEAELRKKALHKQLAAIAEQVDAAEKKLKQTLMLSQEAETRQATLCDEQKRAEAALSAAQARVAALQDAERLAVSATADSESARQRADAALRGVQDEISKQKDELAAITTRREEAEASLADTTQRLAQATASLDEAAMRRAGIEAQCEELASAGEQLIQVREQLTALSAGAARLAEQEHLAQKLAVDTEAAQKRLSDLEARETSLRAEAASLDATIHAHQDTLEQIRRHTAQQAEVARAIDAARKDLAELTARLTPMRDWKEAMDLLYARFADLPQSSPEAQEVWREIEAGKAALRRHIIASQTRAPRIMHIEFARSTKPGTPMKSERIRGKAQA
jgi:hypothetical protein|uniref:FHA domain-containing protein n=1 Tax=Prosthecobacter sp. TaxID=1965333 RepID=UPI0037834AE4